MKAEDNKGKQKFPFKGKWYYIDGVLRARLDSIVYNLKKDFDLVLIITGDRRVRVGKSVMAMTISAYLASAMYRAKMIPQENYSIDDIYFDHRIMVKEAYTKPKFAINHYDEGREGLAASKASGKIQQDLIDFFTECGQLNQIFVIVLPDYFSLGEDTAVPRSEALINCFISEQIVKRDFFKNGSPIHVTKWVRGRFEYFDRRRKQQLYDKSKSIRRKSYALVKHNFWGIFTNQFPIEEELYKTKKKEALRRLAQDNIKETVKGKMMRLIIKKVLKEIGQDCTGKEGSEYLGKHYEIELKARSFNLYKSELLKDKAKESEV